MVRCFDCKLRIAEAVVKLDNKYVPVCNDCLHDYIYYEGEINLDFWPIENLDEIFVDINRYLKYMADREIKLMEQVKSGKIRMWNPQ